MRYFAVVTVLVFLSVRVEGMISCVDEKFSSILLTNNFLLSRVFPKSWGFSRFVDQNIYVFMCEWILQYWEDLEYGGFYFKFKSKFLIISPRHSIVWQNVWMKVSYQCHYSFIFFNWNLEQLSRLVYNGRNWQLMSGNCTTAVWSSFFCCGTMIFRFRIRIKKKQSSTWFWQNLSALQCAMLVFPQSISLDSNP